MTDDNKGGSGSGAGGAAGAVAEVPKNKTAKITMDQALAENDSLRKTVGEKDAMIADLTAQLKEANDVLEGQEKGKLISEILPRSNFKMDELQPKSLEELKNLRATLDHAMPPKVNSVRCGVQAADISDREKGLTVGDRSWVTQRKRKAALGTG